MIASLLSVLLLAATPAPEASAAGNPAGQTAAKPDKPKKICRHSQQEATSRMRSKVCKTAEEWDAAERSGISAAELNRAGVK